MQVPTLPFAQDQAQRDVQRFHQLVSAVAGHTAVVVAAQSTGALSHEETMQALRRQAQDLLVAIALLDERDRT